MPGPERHAEPPAAGGKRGRLFKKFSTTAEILQLLSDKEKRQTLEAILTPVEREMLQLIVEAVERLQERGEE